VDLRPQRGNEGSGRRGLHVFRLMCSLYVPSFPVESQRRPCSTKGGLVHRWSSFAMNRRRLAHPAGGRPGSTFPIGKTRKHP
jgi:hypothetical protein